MKRLSMILTLLVALVVIAPNLARAEMAPIVGAVVEARSPHTWDQPFIIASCALVAVGLSFI